MPHTNEDSSAEGEVGSRTILVIEDDEGIGELITLALAEASPSYFPLVVADAQEALRLTGSMPVDLLVIDYHLADMNGIEVYDSLQGKEELREVPALLLSASIEKHAEELQQRQLVGLPKPFELDELLQAVEQLLM